MGFSTWLLKNGPGSPGSTAKHYTNLFLKIQQSSSYSPSQIWELIYFERHKNSQAIGNKSHKFQYFDSETLYNYSEGDLPLLTFIMLYIETEQFRKGLQMDISGLNLTLKVIFDVVQDKAQNLVKLSYISYRTKAFEFINTIYPDVVS